MRRDALSIRHFSAAWFSMIMGVGAFANTTYMIGAKKIGILVFWLNVILFIFLSIIFVLRVILYFSDIKNDLLSPYAIAFYPTFAVSMLVIGGGAMLMKPFSGYGMFSIFMYIIGSTLVLLFSALMGYSMFTAESVELSHANYSWLIPPVASIVVPMLGNAIVPLVGVYQKLVVVVNVMFFSIGFFLYIFVGSIIFYRMVAHSLPDGKVAPTIWISLGPIGVATVDLIGFKNALFPLGVKLSLAPALMVWGFGIWCYIVSILITIHYWKKTTIPYGLGWWAYIFPLGAYDIATLSLSNALGCEVLFYIGIVFYINLLLNLVITLHNMYVFLHGST